MTDDEAITLATLLGAKPWLYGGWDRGIWYVRAVSGGDTHPVEEEQLRLTHGGRVWWDTEAEAARAVLDYYLTKEKQNEREHAR